MQHLLEPTGLGPRAVSVVVVVAARGVAAGAILAAVAAVSVH